MKSDDLKICDGNHSGSAAGLEPIDDRACVQAAAIFCALGEPARLRLLLVLQSGGELCVGELAEALGDNLSSISQRLKLLRMERIVRSRRQGKHVYYSLADQHVSRLITNGLEHAREATGEARS